MCLVHGPLLSSWGDSFLHYTLPSYASVLLWNRLKPRYKVNSSSIKLFLSGTHHSHTRSNSQSSQAHLKKPVHSTNWKVLTCACFLLPCWTDHHLYLLTAKIAVHPDFSVCSPAPIRTNSYRTCSSKGSHYSSLFLSPFACRLCSMMLSLYIVFKGKAFFVLRPQKFSRAFPN